MGASSKQDRLKDVKVKPPDKGTVGRFVRTKVDLSDVIPPGVVDQSSATIYRTRRKSSATGAVVSGIGKAEWKLEGLHKARKPNRGDSLLRTPMDAEDYYVDDVTEEEREDASESDGVWESDSSASKVACQASIKGSSSNVMDEVTKVLPPIILEDSIPSGNTANLSKNWEIPKDAVVFSSPNSDVNHVKSHMINVSPPIAVSIDSSPEMNKNGVQVEVIGISVKSKEMNEEEKGTDDTENEFIPGIGFKFLSDETMERENLVENNGDLDYLNKSYKWDDSGNLVVDSDVYLSKEEGEIKDNGPQNLSSYMHLSLKKTVTVINNINLEPSILGDASKGRQDMDASNYEGEKILIDVTDKVDSGQKISYAGALNGRTHKRKLQVKFIPPIDGSDEGLVVLPIDNLKKASIPFMNTLYGYLLDKKIGFPVISAEVRKMWKNMGLEDVFMNSKGFLFFKFNSEQGMRQILDNSPWIILNKYPLFIQRWRPGLALTKESHKSVPVWIKIFDLPLEAWSAENLCIIATVIQNFVVEYAWRPSRCSSCKVYGHDDSICLAVINGKNAAVKSDIQDVIDKDGEGYTMVTKKAGNVGTAAVKGYGTGDVQANVSRTKGSNWNGANNKRGSYNSGNKGNKGWNNRSHSGNWNRGSVSHWNHQKNQEFVAANNKPFVVDKQGNNGKESVDSGKKEEKVKKGKGMKGSQKENNFVNTVNRFAVLSDITNEIVDRLEDDFMSQRVDSFKSDSGGLENSIHIDPGPSYVNSHGVNYVINSKGDSKMKKLPSEVSNNKLEGEGMECSNQVRDGISPKNMVISHDV
ncbi:unnamed protein product [Lactuca virosa]|uniref:DUF4283 domain-containing protein n=1 Tax=Lactuca virosa TaxID=75947 RepID=A0AAU9LQ38_9ASTR|nr:unnamed protein product [Lactuca virosa]